MAVEVCNFVGSSNRSFVLHHWPMGPYGPTGPYGSKPAAGRLAVFQVGFAMRLGSEAFRV